MKQYDEIYRTWLNSPVISDEEREELRQIENNGEEIESRFYAPLVFGTAGLRGLLGMGLNRMNVYIVRQVTQGIANLISSLGESAKMRGVAIAYDCRLKSDVFAKEASSVLSGNGICVFLFESMRPTPELSFAIRQLHCIAGINITASHNPKEYNGYKVYWEDGAQLPPKEASAVAAETETIDIFTGVKTTPFEKAKETGLIHMIGKEIDEQFLKKVLDSAVDPDCVKNAPDDFKLVYTPFHGTGYRLVPEALSRLGCRSVFCVPEQMIPDGAFPTVKSPNPEEKAGFALAIDYAKKENIDLIVGTDPDADRIGVVFRDKSGDYIPLSGNQVGVLLADYIIRARRKKGTLPENAAVIKSLVTTEMARKICEKNSVACIDTFTGFKFMAERIKEFEENGAYSCILAFEESIGYLIGNHVRDKDAVTASVLIAEMAAYYKTKNMTLGDALQELFKTYGCFAECTVNSVMPGVDGLLHMSELMASLRKNPPLKIGGTPVLYLRDYLSGKKLNIENNKTEPLELSGSDVLYFGLSDGTRFIIRPSGTEPKIKTYILASGESLKEAMDRTERYKNAVGDLIK
ncbi:MAG: phospho-sugar mutase [Bacillota bacterium]|nr:phospho-sugar mutase [Bacillota bacterium]